MQSPLTVFTDKVMRMIKAMVYLSMRVTDRRGATVEEISSSLNDWAPSGAGMYHQGVVERVLRQLYDDGKVTQAGARWYLASAA
jgi:hypothetical protein